IVVSRVSPARSASVRASYGRRALRSPRPPRPVARWETIGVDDDEKLLRRAEETLTEIKVARGLSDRHAAVLAALRIRLKGKADKSLDEMLEAAGDVGSGRALQDLVQEKKPKRSLDDLLAEKKTKPEWPSG